MSNKPVVPPPPAQRRWFILSLCALLLVAQPATQAAATSVTQAGAALGAAANAVPGLCASNLPPQPAQVLYDATAGSLPSQQQWQFITSPGAVATQTYTNGLTVFDTLTQSADLAGYFVAPTQPITLDRSVGFVLSFRAQVISETHHNADRAGLSVIVIASDGKGIELGFWADSVWAQGDGIHPPEVPLFNRAETSALTATQALSYQLAILGDSYTLLVDGAPILSGPIRDYSAFSGFPDPYETPNLIFIGDDTSSAQAQVALGELAVARCLALPAGTLLAAGSTWRYHDDGVYPGDNWRALNFDDSAWRAGPAPLGYGDPVSTTLSFGPDPNNKPITAYFRQTIEVTQPLSYTALEVQLKRDDGAVLYLNGTEIMRSNMPAGAITNTTLAQSVVSTDEDVWFSAPISASALTTGTNILAAEVHQSGPTSSDLRFDLSLQAMATLTSPITPTGSVRFAAIGDFGDLDSQPNFDVAALVKSWNVDFVTTVGDNSYCFGGVTPDSYDDCVARYYHDWIAPYTGKYGAGAGTGADQNRFWPIMGNHDWDNGLSAYRAAFVLPGNGRYYELRRGPVHFFMLDSDDREPDGNSATSAQATWLQAALAQSDAPWKLVYMHHAPYSSSEHGNSLWMRWPFAVWGATAVLAGHDHVYERIAQDIPYFVDGLGGRSLYSFRATPTSGSVLRYNKDYGALLVEANDCTITYRFITRTGVTVDSYSQARACAAFSHQVHLPMALR